MASSQVEVRGSDVQLKHLWFVKVLTLNAVVLVSNLYDTAKQNSGSLKSTIGKVENAVKAVVGPVYQKFNGLPSDLLVFLDDKVDKAISRFDESAPPAAKKAVFKVQLVINKASNVALNLVEEAKVSGPVAVISHVGSISKQFTVSQLAVVWYKVNQYPAVYGISKMAIPTAEHWSEKYNKLVKDLSTKGCSFFNYVPLVPVDELVKAYKQVESAAAKKTDAGSSSGSESDKE
ncbi:hypothetical protein ABTP16_15995 [Acinetobacter baumannii]